MQQQAQAVQQKLHLSWDEKQKNGIIINKKYQNGVMYHEDMKPQIEVEYDTFMYTEVFDMDSYIELNGIKRELTINEIKTIKSLIVNWIQAVGTEGNPSEEQINNQHVADAKFLLHETSLLTQPEINEEISETEKSELTKYRKSLVAVVKNPAKTPKKITPSLDALFKRYNVNAEDRHGMSVLNDE